MAPILWKNKTSENSQQSAQIFGNIDKKKLFLLTMGWPHNRTQLNSHHVLRNWYHLEICTTWIVINLLSFLLNRFIFHFVNFICNSTPQVDNNFLQHPTPNPQPPQKNKKKLECLVTQRVHVFANLSSIRDKTSCFPYCCHECWIYKTIYERITHSVYKVKVKYINIEFNDFQFHHPSW